MKPVLIIERAKPTDYEGIAAIYNESIRKGVATMEEELKAAEDIAQWVAAFHEREALFAMHLESRLIGWGIIKRYSDRGGYRFACETAIYLTEGETGKGYGGSMKKYLIKICKEMGYRHLVAKVFATNTASILYNQRLGYEIVGRQKKIGFKNGQWQDMTIMQYLIED